MKAIKLICLGAATAFVATLIGCSASTGTSSNSGLRPSSQYRKPSIGSSTRNLQASETAQAQEVDYYGWRGYKLTNGLVSVIAVPALGGRIMEYNLGQHRFLWVNESELGAARGSGAEEGPQADRSWKNWGGYKVWPAPQSKWGGPPDPKGSKLDGGEWTGKIVRSAGSTATIEMTSPADNSVTGLQMTRRVSLEAKSTKLTIDETYTNVSKRDISWAVWTVTQVPGYVGSNKRPSTDAQVFFPINSESAHPGGYFKLLDSSSAQFTKVADGKVLQVSYKGEQGKIGADSTAGWIAYVDDSDEFCLVQRFSAHPGAEYPDKGSIVQVYTSPAEECYMEVEVNSPIKTIAPGKSYTFTEHWQCTRLGGPITKATPAGAIKAHPTGAKQGSKLIVSGEIGVFAPGRMSVEFYDENSKPLDRSKPINVAPNRKVQKRIMAEIPKGAHSAMLVLSDSEGKAKIGNIAEIPLGSKVAKAAGGGEG